MTTSVRLGETALARIGLGTNRLTHTRENVEFVRQAVAAGDGRPDVLLEESLGAIRDYRDRGDEFAVLSD